MSEVCCHCDQISDSFAYQKLRGTILPADWGRYPFYATRVRSLGSDQEFRRKRSLADPLAISHEAFEAIRAANSCRPLLPRLKNLTWTVEVEDTTGQIQYFMAPTVRFEMFVVAARSDAIGSMLSNFDQRLTCSGSMIMRTLDLAAGLTRGCLSRFDRIRYLSLECVRMHCHTLHELSKLPGLLALCLDVAGLEPFTAEDVLLMGDTSEPSFPSLEYLEIETDEPNLVDCTLTLVEPSVLRTLKINCPLYQTAIYPEDPIFHLQALETLSVSSRFIDGCINMRQHLLLPGLTRLDVEILALGQRPDFLGEILNGVYMSLQQLYVNVRQFHLDTTPSEALHVLSYFPYLTYVEIGLGSPYWKPEDAFVETMAEACHHLDVSVGKSRRWNNDKCMRGTIRSAEQGEEGYDLDMTQTS